MTPETSAFLLTPDQLFWTNVLVHMRFAIIAMLVLTVLWILATHEGDGRYQAKRVGIALVILTFNVASMIITLLILKVPFL